MKKTLLLLFFFIAAMGTHADEEHRVKLSDKHNKETIGLGFCNIFITKVDSDDDGNAKVEVEIENPDETNAIVLFGRAYSEKELKKQTPSIAFDKIIGGTKGHRKVDAYDTYSEGRNGYRNDYRLEPNKKIKLPGIHVEQGKVKTCLFPLYIAQRKEKKFLGLKTGTFKTVLIEKKVQKLEIEVEIKPDENLIRLGGECNALIDSIGRLKFCNNPKHKPSLEKQEARCRERISEIKAEIDEIIEQKGWMSIDKAYQMYNELKQKLNTIDFTAYEEDCGKHKVIQISERHSCKYCSSSLQQIYHILDDYYKKIYNSSNRKATKESVMADVNLLYRCCTDENCKKHASSWNKSEYKSKITDRYNRIVNF